MENNTIDLKNISEEAFASFGAPKMVYVREVRAGKIAEQAGQTFDVPADAIVYAVHAADGTPMAVVENRDLAFAGARQYDLEPVSVH